MSKYFAHFSHAVSDALGKPIAFIVALVVVCNWAVAGPVFVYSQVWQLVINTGTTIVTFLMIFVVQNSQNSDGQALQAKLDELILTNKNAENRFIGIEKLDEEEPSKLRKLIAHAGETTTALKRPQRALDKHRPNPLSDGGIRDIRRPN